MAESFSHIAEIDPNEFTERVESGLLVPLHATDGLEVVDCADDRGLTPDYYAKRTLNFGHEVSPGRYFGAASGLAAAAMITFAAEQGEQAVTQFIGNYTPEAFVDLSSDVSDRAHRILGIDLNQHSDDSKERNPVELGDHKTCEDPLGCKFATSLGAVIVGANMPEQVAEARVVASVAGLSLPINEAAEGLRIIQKHVPADFGIHRGALHHAQTRSSKHTPIAIHQGHHAPNEQARLINDLAGFRSNANASNAEGLYRYIHTPGLANELLGKLMPELRLDSRILEATGLLLSASTRVALSGADTPHALRVEVIPPEYAIAA